MTTKSTSQNISIQINKLLKEIIKQYAVGDAKQRQNKFRPLQFHITLRELVNEFYNSNALRFEWIVLARERIFVGDDPKAGQNIGYTVNVLWMAVNTTRRVRHRHGDIPWLLSCGPIACSYDKTLVKPCNSATIAAIPVCNKIPSRILG
jgi:hypothetical protein